jgi:hypothetical protein
MPVTLRKAHALTIVTPNGQVSAAAAHCRASRRRLQTVSRSNDPQLVYSRRSKCDTPAGWRDPSLNDTCLEALRELLQRAQQLGFAEREHFLFLSSLEGRGVSSWHGQHRRLDPTRLMTSWRSAWRSLRKAAGLPHVRFHDGRHTALTRLAEKGLPDWVIRGQFGHVSPAMMAVYSHVRRKALEPETPTAMPPIPDPPSLAPQDERVMSHVTSQSASSRNNVVDFA